MKHFLVHFALFAACLGNGNAVTTTLYGPSPYLGAFDSPFYAGIQAGTIYLEDFEDHTLNTPFIIVNDFSVNPANRWVSTTVHSENPVFPANSVDADDGLLGDFKGFAGDSLINVLPPGGIGNRHIHEFLFTPDAMGRYPTYVGFVVTDPEDFDRDVIVRMDDPTGDNIVGLDEIHFDPFLWLAGAEFNGDTRIHRFIGAYSSDGIAFLQITGVDELDHLQYGYAIPEPAAGALAVLALAFLVLRRNRR